MKTRLIRSALFRLQFIVGMLLKKKAVTAWRIAQELETSTKTVNRDMDLLRQMGFELKTNLDGGGLPGYQMVSGCCPFCRRAMEARHFEKMVYELEEAPDAAAVHFLTKEDSLREHRVKTSV